MIDRLAVGQSQKLCTKVLFYAIDGTIRNMRKTNGNPEKNVYLQTNNPNWAVDKKHTIFHSEVALKCFMFY